MKHIRVTFECAVHAGNDCRAAEQLVRALMQAAIDNGGEDPRASTRPRRCDCEEPAPAEPTPKRKGLT